MLFDKDTKKITAILDFDWSHVSNPYEEFKLSLGELGCNIPAGVDNEITAALLSGDPLPLQTYKGDEESSNKREMLKMWSVAMKKAGVMAPSDIKGVDRIRDIGQLATLLCPYKLTSKAMLEKMDEEQTSALRAKAEADLVQLLEKYGF